MRNDGLRELGDLNSLITSNGFKIYLRLLDEHKGYLQKEVNKFVRGKDLTEAYGALSKLDDIDKQLKLLEYKIKDLEKEKKNG